MVCQRQHKNLFLRAANCCVSTGWDSSRNGRYRTICQELASLGKGIFFMKRLIKAVLGSLTILPFFYLLWANMVLVPMFRDRNVTSPFNLFFTLNLIGLSLTFVLLIGFLTHLYRNQKVHQNRKTIWTIALLFGSFLAMPIYWWMYIWPTKERVVKPKPVRK